MTASEIKEKWIIADIDSSTVSIHGYKGNDTEIEIPAVVGNKTVTEIGSRAFRPESHKSQRAVYRALTKITLPNTIQSIGSEAFANCVGLEDINLPESLTHVSESVFSGCYSLKEITIPKSLKQLGTHMFSHCKSLEYCVFSSEETEISRGSFFQCANLKKLIVRDEKGEHPYFLFSNGWWNRLDYALTGCISLKEIYFSDKTTVIWEGICCHCASLKQIIIPNGVQCIQMHAFSECNSIKEVHIPASVKRIDTWAFSSLENLEMIVVDNPNIDISPDAFVKCPKLMPINLPTMK